MGWRSHQAFGVFQVPQPRLLRFPGDSGQQSDILGVPPCRGESKSPKTSQGITPSLRPAQGSPTKCQSEGFIPKLDPHRSGLEQHLHPCPALPGLTFHSLHFLTSHSKENRAAPWYSVEICSKLVQTPPHPSAAGDETSAAVSSTPVQLAPFEIIFNWRV